MRLIDADELFTTPMPNARGNGKPLLSLWAYVVDQITHAPTIDPESLRPKGRWEKHWCDNSLIGHMYEVCPNCRSCEILDTDKFWDSNYCPNCGAKMEG